MSKTLDDIQLKLRSLKSELGEFKTEFKTFVTKTEEKFNKLYEIMDGLIRHFPTLKLLCRGAGN